MNDFSNSACCVLCFAIGSLGAANFENVSLKLHKFCSEEEEEAVLGFINGDRNSKG